MVVTNGAGAATSGSGVNTSGAGTGCIVCVPCTGTGSYTKITPVTGVVNVLIGTRSAVSGLGRVTA